MEEAPEGGCLLFDILTVEPDEENFFYHPLPAQAMVQELRCTYKRDVAWACDTETGDPQWPEWHDHLAPNEDPARRLQRRNAREQRRRVSGQQTQLLLGGASGKLLRDASDPARRFARGLKSVGLRGPAELSPVHIRQLRLPGAVSPEVFQILAETSHLAIFEREATQSILEYIWRSFVGSYYTVQLMHRTIEIAVLVTWTFYETTWTAEGYLSEWMKRCCWSFILVSSLRETTRKVGQACGHTLMGDARNYFLNCWNYVDLAVIFMFNAFSWSSMRTLELNADPRIFAAVSLFRWLQLLYTLRAYKLGSLGVRGIMPILHSLKEIGGILVICLFTFLGFTHCFLALDQDPDNWEAVVIDTFRLLFLGDGNGINRVLTLGSYSSMAEISVAFIFLVVAVMVFCISLLNLFIAVHGEAYAEANRNAMALHLQERAALCLHCMMQPQWPPPDPISRRLGVLGRRFRQPLLAYLFLSLVTVPAWLGLLYIRDLHPAVTSLFALAAVLLGNCFLVQRPWESEMERESSIIWWCAPVREVTWSDEDQDDIVMKQLGHLERRTDDIARHLAQLEEKIDVCLGQKDKIERCLPVKKARSARCPVLVQ
mmetsp:Transcript_33647/g.105408  ORF Transcript_33647/g.105408 Transcript_33647/m.105408 type:complete len:600 (-) Transcript_33647:31-1830(-)